MKKLIYAAAAFLAVFALVFTACNEADDGGQPSNNPNTNVETWSVTFIPGNNAVWPGGNSADKVVKVEKGKALGNLMPENPTFTGHRFLGWQDSVLKSSFDRHTDVNADITVNAQWEVVENDTSKPDLDGTASFSSNGTGNEAYRIGKILTLDDSDVRIINGTPESGTDYSYVWKAANEVISGATGKTYTITGKEAGKEITCEIHHSGADFHITARGQKVPFELFLEITSYVDSVAATVTGDTVSLSPEFGHIGDTITLTFDVVAHKVNNQIVFSGVENVQEEPIEKSGAGTLTFDISNNDAVQAMTTETDTGRIKVLVEFNHSDLIIETVAFPDNDSEVTIEYGTTGYINTIHSTSQNTTTRPVRYFIAASDTQGIVTVNETTGEVTIIKVGETRITGEKAATATHARSYADYVLTVSPRQLNVLDTVVEKEKFYNGDAAATVTSPGRLERVLDGDQVSVTATATYASSAVGTNINITVVFTLTGNANVLANYAKPADLTLTGGVIKEEGWTVTFDTDGGTAVADHFVTKGGVLGPVAPPTKANYLFQGWYETADTGFTTEFIEATLITKNTDLKARWIQGVALPVNGWVSFFGGVVENGDTLSFEGTQNQILRYVFPDDTGIENYKKLQIVYTLPGTGTATGTKQVAYRIKDKFPNIATVQGGAETNLTGEWANTMILNTEGATITVDLNAVHTAKRPNIGGFEFQRQGWDGAIGNEWKIKIVSMSLLDYEEWIEPPKHTITFDMDGADTAQIDPIEVYTGLSMGAAYPANPSKDGFSFAGWKDLESNAIIGSATPITKNLTLTAQWGSAFPTSFSLDLSKWKDPNHNAADFGNTPTCTFDEEEGTLTVIFATPYGSNNNRQSLFIPFTADQKSYLVAASKITCTITGTRSSSFPAYRIIIAENNSSLDWNMTNTNVTSFTSGTAFELVKSANASKATLDLFLFQVTAATSSATLTLSDITFELEY